MKSKRKFLFSLTFLILCATFLLQAKQYFKIKADSYDKQILSDSPQQKVKLTEAFPALSFNMPVEFVSPNDATNRNFVVAQRGKIHVFANKPDVKETTVFLDIESKVTAGGERGLLGLAFHPKFKTNGQFYLNYTRNNSGLETVISRFTVSKTNINRAEAGSEEVLLTIKQPYSNHNGGKIAFGNDGFLYIGVGDGGSGGDPQRHGQNKASLLGKILRIDVDKRSGDLKYSIPSDNPFQGNSLGFRDEIFAYGIRNPWRFSFDKVTGELWMGDVGQNKIEEIDIVKKGGNYGWNIMEAEDCYGQANCDTRDMILPVWSYRQGPQTGSSVTGGHVYRGKTVKALQGKYIYGDYVTGNIWALSPDGKGKYTNALLVKHKGMISSFGEDANSELFVCSYGDGKIYKITP